MMSLNDDLMGHVLESLVTSSELQSPFPLACVSSQWTKLVLHFGTRRAKTPVQTSDRVEMQELYARFTVPLRSTTDYIDMFDGDYAKTPRALRQLAYCVGRTEAEVMSVLGLEHSAWRTVEDALFMEDAVKSRTIVVIVAREVQTDEPRLVCVTLQPTSYQGVWEQQILCPFDHVPRRIQWLMHRYSLVETTEGKLPRSPICASSGFFVRPEADGGIAHFRTYTVTEEEQVGESTTDWLVEWKAYGGDRPRLTCNDAEYDSNSGDEGGDSISGDEGGDSASGEDGDSGSGGEQ